MLPEHSRHGPGVLLRSSQLQQLRVEGGVIQAVGSRGPQDPAESAHQGCCLLTLTTGGWTTTTAEQHFGRLHFSFSILIRLSKVTSIASCLTLMALMLEREAISAKIQSGQSRPPHSLNFISFWKIFEYFHFLFTRPSLMTIFS